MENVPFMWKLDFTFLNQLNRKTFIDSKISAKYFLVLLEYIFLLISIDQSVNVTVAIHPMALNWQ